MQDTQMRDDPLIGALLRAPLQHVRLRVVSALESAGIQGITAAHLNVLQHPAPRGARPTDLAHRAGMTKQSVNHLLRELEALGYIERRPGRADGREREVWLTDSGEAAVRVVRRAVRDVEKGWETALGQTRYEALRKALVVINERIPGSAVSPPT